MTKEDIKQEFKGVEGINEAKKIYKTLAKNFIQMLEVMKRALNF